MISRNIIKITGGLALIRHKLIAGALAPFLAFSLAGCSGSVFQSLFAEGNEATILAMALLNGSPRITSVTSTKDDGRYGIGSDINVTVTFSKAVDLAGGNLNVTLDSGAVVPITPFTNATTASATYTVAAGQNSADLRATAITLDPGATLTKASNSKTAALSLPGNNFSSKNIVIDTTPPTISSVTSSTADGLYGVGASINVTVVFSEPIVLSDGPHALEVTLDTGDVVSVSAGSFPASQLTGTYTVGTGDISADLNSNASLHLAAGSITDTCDENFNTLSDFDIPSGQNLADTKAIVIDGVAPTNQDSVFSPSVTKKGTDTVTIGSSGDASNQVWFAPAGTTNFIAGPTMTMAGGTSTVIDAPDTEGTYYIYIIDAAGNVSSPSIAVLTVDNTAPVIAITAPNSGADFTTGTASQVLSGSCSMDSTVTISTSTGTVSDGDCSDGTWSLDAISLAEGANTITVTATDGAGNAASDSMTITLDTSLRSVAITYLQGGRTTSPFKAGILAITATFEVAPTGTPQIAIDQAGTNDLTATDMSGSGTTWTYTYTVNAAGGGNADGAATITLSNIVPTGGGIYGTPSDRVFTIDTTAAAPSVPDLAAADDTGAFNNDDITSKTTGLHFSGTAESNATVELFDGVASLGTVNADVSGNWTITVDLSSGAHSINAVQTDAAGNVSPASGNLSLTIDTSASAPSAPDLDAADDTGSSNSDNLTNKTSGLTFSGTSENSATIRLYDGATQLGSTTADGSGNWTVDLSLSAGSYSIHAEQTDLAGNVSPASGALALTIDASAPSAPSVPDFDAADDTGSSNSDNITKQTSGLTFSGTAENNASIELFDGATSLGTATADGSGIWTIDIGLAEGTHLINARQTDTAGNVSSASGNLSVTVDSTASAPSIPDLASDDDTGASNTDNITNTTTGLTFSGTAENNASIEIFNGAASLGTTTADGSGNWTIDLALGAGTYSINAVQTDPAGNTSVASGNLPLAIDTTNPVISSVSPASSANVNSTLVSYTFSEICGTASITWARISGSPDSGSPHVQALTGSELNAGAHSNVTIANNPSLVDGTHYDMSFNCADLTGNNADTVTSTDISFSDSPLTIVSAETMDTDNDGKIDTYRIAFNKSVNDSTFPGYIANSLGTVTSNWLVAGYINVRLIHGTAAAAFATDTPNDSVIYVRFDESLLTCSASDQSGCDTGAKPDLTTTTSPGLSDLASNPLAQVGSSAVTEADGAKPRLMAARSLNSTQADVIFSEDMEQSTAETSTYYTIDNGVSVTGASRDSGNNKVVHLTTSTQVGGAHYTLTVNTFVKDMANLSLDPTANTISFDGNVKPIVVSIETVNATTLTITFNESVTAASAECANLTECAAIYDNPSLPVKSAVSTGGSGVNSETYTLTVNPMAEGQSYTTYVLQDTVTSVASGQKMGSVNNSATFTGDGKPGAYISTDTVTACPANSYRRVVVQYDQAVTATALTTTNYKITLCLANAPCYTGTGSPNSSGASSVTSLGGNKYAVDFTDSFDTDTSEYQLSITNVADANGNVVNAPTNLGFRCGDDLTPPGLIHADVVSANGTATQVMLTFSESVDQVTANTSSSYKFDSQAYGYNVYSAARQSDYSKVLVTFAPGLAAGGHQIRVQNVQDLASIPNTIVDNGINNVQPIIVTAPSSLGGGDVFTDPFNDGTKAALIVRYDNKLYLGSDSTSTKLFEVDYGLTTSQLILVDADGSAGAPVQGFYDYTTLYSNSGTKNPDTRLKGVDTLYAACVGGTSTPEMTGPSCTAAGGTEILFIGGLNIAGQYKSFWHTSDKSSATTTFTFTEEQNPDSGGAYAFRSTVFLLFKDQLFNHFGAEAGGGGRGGRVCMKTGGCDDGTPYLNTLTGGFPNISSITRIGVSGSPMKNGSQTNIVQSLGGDASHTLYLNAINSLYEYDNDSSAGSNESQLYMANGGVYLGTLGQARMVGSNSDGGIVRTQLTYSTRSSLPVNCTGTGCPTYWEDVTPDWSTKWNSFVSIPYPENSAITGSAYCSSSQIEMDCSEPFNLFTPSMKAIPYMRTAPNGDLYLIRNACSSTTVCYNGGTCDFRTTKQVCPKGSEVTQLWMLPKYSGTCTLTTALTGTVATTNGSANVTGTGTSFHTQLYSGASITINGQTKTVSYITDSTHLTTTTTFSGTGSGYSITLNDNNYATQTACTSGGGSWSSGTTGSNGASKWQLVAEYSSSGKTNMQGNDARGANNTHASLLEFVGNYLYIGFDNATNGANIWRADMSGIPSGSAPAESAFTMVNIPGLDGSSTNQKIYSHITINEGGTDWLILTTRDGSNAVRIYRTANGQN